MRRALAMVFVLVIITNLGTTTAKNDEPPIPYYDYGACPFECCTYRTWTATAETILRENHSDSSPVVGTVKAGETVQGLTGVVITTKPGEVKILKAITMDEKKKIHLKPGDIIYYLHYVGEGFDMFWFRGEIFVDQTSIETDWRTEYWEVITPAEWVWWAKIRMSNGKVGWTRELNNFSNIDACA